MSARRLSKADRRSCVTTNMSGIHEAPPVRLRARRNLGVAAILAAATLSLIGSPALTVSAFAADTTTPVVTISSPTNGLITADDQAQLSYGVSDSFDGPASIFCDKGNNASIPLVAGINAVIVTCTDVAGNSGTNYVTVVRDNGPPVVKISSPLNGLDTTADSVLLKFTAGDTYDANPYCSDISDSTYGLSQGINTITVSCTDLAGNEGIASVTVTRDNTVPVVSISSPVNGSTTTSSPATLGFSVSDSGTPAGRITCNRSNPSSVVLSPGANSNSVTCGDPAGNSHTALTTTTYNPPAGTPPQTTISTYASPAAASTELTSVSFFSDTGTSFECRVDAGAYLPCTSPWNLPLSGLAGPAGHTYDIRALNTAGPDLSPARGHVYVDDRGWAVVPSITAQTNSSSPTPLAAGAHPNLSIALQVQGANDPASMTLQFPDGFMISSAALASDNYCALADANAGECGSASELASVVGTIANVRDGQQSALGKLYLVDPAGLGSQYTAGVALELLAPNDLGKVRTVFGLQFIDEARRQQLVATAFPTETSGGTDAIGGKFHLLNLSATLTGNLGATANPTTSHPLLTNPNYCGAVFSARPDMKRFVLASTGRKGGAPSSVYSDYAVTSCSSQAFAPSFSSALTDTTTGHQTRATMTMNLPPASGSLRSSALLFPPQVGTNGTAWGASADQCSNTSISNVSPSGKSPQYQAFSPIACPARSTIGTVTLTSPLFPEPLKGRLFIVDKSPFPAMGIRFAPSYPGNPQGLSFGIALFTATAYYYPTSTCDNTIDPTCPSGLQFSMPSWPDIPITQLKFTWGDNTKRGFGLAPEILRNVTSMDPACIPNQFDSSSSPTARFTATTYSSPTTGTTAVMNGEMPITKCAGVPDTKIPVVTIAAPTQNALTGAASVPVTFGVTDDGIVKSCSLVSGASVPLTSGVNSITVSCVDGVGNSGSATVQVIRDDVAPVVTITSPASGSQTTSSTALLTYSATDAHDPAPTCNWPNNSIVNLSQGPNTFTVTCTDAFGNAGMASTTVTYTLPPKPQTVINAYADPAAAPTETTSVTFTSDSGTSYECRVDAQVYAPCSSPWPLPLSGLVGPADHTYDVRAVNIAGPDLSPARGHVYIDERSWAVVPSVTAQSNPSAATPMKAGAHPNLNISLQVQGSNDPASVTLQMPDGLMIAPAAIPSANLCSLADANSGQCPATSELANVAANLANPRDGQQSALGKLYMVDATGMASQYAVGIALELTLAGDLGKIRTVFGLQFIDQMRRQQLTATAFPTQTIGGADPVASTFHLLNLSTVIVGDKGITSDPATSHPLVTNPDYCGTVFSARPYMKQFVMGAIGRKAAATSVATSDYVVANCSSRAFAPSFEADSSANVAGAPTRITTSFSVPPENGTVRNINFVLPPHVGWQTAAFGSSADKCDLTSIFNVSPTGKAPAYSTFVPTQCPPQALIGTASFSSPMFAAPLTGQIYFVDKAPLPNYGVWFDASTPGNPRGVSFGLALWFSTTYYYPISTCDNTKDPTCAQGIVIHGQTPSIPLGDLNLVFGTNTSRGTLGAAIFRLASPGDPVCLPNSIDPSPAPPAKLDIWSYSRSTSASGLGAVSNLIDYLPPLTGCT